MVNMFKMYDWKYVHHHQCFDYLVLMSIFDLSTQCILFEKIFARAGARTLDALPTELPGPLSAKDFGLLKF